jgi:glycosyltransferase involved in cell wall biosynthesis
LWSDPNYIKQEVSFAIRPFVGAILSRMKKWDYSGAQRVSKFVANSKEVQERIKEYYKRDSEVIYPFIDLDFWKPSHNLVIARSASDEAILPQEKIASDALAMTNGAEYVPTKKDYFLIAGRLQAHKKNDLIIEIFNELGLPLHVVGTGRQEEYLKSISKPNVTFLGRVSDEQLRDEYSGALGYIFPQNEDFGLMPLEAADCGTATLAYGQGGALETIIPGQTGEFFQSYDKEKIKQMILSWNLEKYKPLDLRSQAEKFSKEKFKQSILEVLKI